jgi:hypothetical protein
MSAVMSADHSAYRSAKASSQLIRPGCHATNGQGQSIPHSHWNGRRAIADIADNLALTLDTLVPRPSQMVTMRGSPLAETEVTGAPGSDEAGRSLSQIETVRSVS